MSNQQRKKAHSNTPVAATPEIDTRAGTLPGTPANDTEQTPRGADGTRPWMKSPMPDGFTAMGTLSGVPSEKIGRLLQAAENKNVHGVIAAILALYDGPGDGFELCVSAVEKEGRMYWTFRGDRCPDAELQSAA